MRSKLGPKRVIGWLWRYSLVLTVPIAMLYLYWGWNVGTRFYDLGLRYGNAVDNPDLYSMGVYEKNRIKSMARIGLFEKGAQDEEQFRQVHLMINQGEERALSSRLPGSGRSYKDGYIQYPDGQLGKVDLRYRGDFAWHWGQHKKSWRVKTPRGAMWNNMRTFNLVVPKGMGMIEDSLGYWFASEFGLLAPESDLVELIVNGHGRGLHTFVEQLEELVLRKNGRMPGDLYAGELIGRDNHVGIVNWVFDHPGLWEKVAINNHFDDHENEAMRRLCELLDAPASEESLAELRGLIDIEAFGRFAAYRVLTQSRHFDRTHNWRLFYDPWKCHFEPVVWDTVPWHKDWMPREGAEPWTEPLYCRLDDRLAVDHQYRIAIDKSIQEFFDSGLDKRLIEKFDTLVATSRDALRRDPVITFKLNYVTPEQVLAYQQKLRKGMVKMFGQLKELYKDQPPMMISSKLGSASATERSWRVALFGRRSIDGIRIELEEPISSSPEVWLAYQVGEKTRRIDVSGACTILGRSIDVNVPMIGGMVYEANPNSTSYADRGKLVPEIASYDLTLRSSRDEAMRPLRLSALLGNDEAILIPSQNDLESYPLNGQFGVIPEPAETQVLVLEGEVEFDGQQIIRQPVLIRAGTTLRMGPEASLVIEGTLLAQGTEANPIRVLPKEGQTIPWGTFAIRGPGSDGSVLEFVQFKGGSGWKQPLAEFSSMFSIHWVQNVLVKHCLFEDSYIVDDMVHGVYSEVRFASCTFKRSLADALDMDISEVAIDDCLFEKSGNDAVDLMTSHAIVQNTRFIHSFDKGISIGENSTLLALNCLFDGCEIGLQSKDESQAAVVNCDIVNCVWGIDAYKKNWRYNGGGEIYLYKSRVMDSKESLRADKHSIVGVSDSYVDDLQESWERAFVRGPGMQAQHPTKSGMKPTSAYRFEREQKVLAPLGSAMWDRVRTSQRGSTFLKIK